MNALSETARGSPCSRGAEAAGRVSIVIVNWNRCELLRRCLVAVRRQTLRPSEVIVVDNGSIDGTRAMVQSQFPDARLLSLEQNAGFGTGSNLGIRAATGEFVALLNNDTEPEPGWLEELCKAMRTHPEAGMCASKVVRFGVPTRLDAAGDDFLTVGIALKRGDAEVDRGQFDRPGWVFGASAAAALYRCELVLRVGLFDAGFSPAYYEDTDLSFRLQLQGARCWYVPTAVARHHVSATLGEHSRMLLYLRARNAWYVVVKNLPTGLWWRYGPAIVAYPVIAGCYYLLSGRGIGFLAGWLAAWRGLPQLLAQRRAIQQGRVVSDRELQSQLTGGGVFGALRRQWRRRRFARCRV